MKRSDSLTGVESRGAWGFLAFPLVIILVFSAVPALAGVVLSFFQWSGGGAPQFIGLQNYSDLLVGGEFGAALRNTLLIALVTVPVTVVFAFLLAVAVNADWFRGRTLIRTVLFIPSVISIVAIGFIWRWVLSPGEAGLLNAALLELGLLDAPRLWIDNSAGGLATLIGVNIWRGLGFSLVLYLAALSGVSASNYDAAAVDGAGPWATMWSITWPSVRPMTWFLLITGTIGALQVFDLVLVMVGLVQQDWTDVLNLFLYREFSQDRVGFAASIGVIVLLVTAVVTVAQLWWLRRPEGASI